MTAEHLLEAMGLLDDGLIQEAEQYSAPGRRARYGMWIQWAASFAVVLVLGYGIFQLGMTSLVGSGGGANAGGNTQASGNAPEAPSASSGADMEANGSTGGGDGMPPPGEPVAPDGPGGTDEGLGGEAEQLAVVIDGVVYQSTGERISLFPDGDDIRRDLSWYNEGAEGAVSDPYLCCVMLEDGSAAVSWAFQYEGWLIFEPAGEP